jgi:hypothetical protein
MGAYLMTFRVVRPKAIIYILTLPSLLLLAAVSLFFLASTINILNYIFLIVMFSISFALFSIFVARRIVITERGIEYRTIFNSTKKSWEEIKFIGVNYPLNVLDFYVTVGIARIIIAIVQ